jgi:hypothetical protein
MGRAEASDALLRRAIAAYDRLAARIEAIGDPDLGLEVVHSCGRRRLLARAHAKAWTVPARVVRRVDELLDGIEDADEAARIDWLEAFPSEVTRALERRHPAAEPPGDAPRRRMIDWVGRSAPAVAGRA